MDGYFQSTLAASSLQSNVNRNTSNTVTKVVVHFPPSNKEFSCNELHTPDGVYPLLHETFHETIAPQFATGTRSSIVREKRRPETTDEEEDIESSYSSSTGSSNHHFGLSMTPVIPIPNASRKHVRNRSSISSVSPGLTIITPSQKNNSYAPFSPSFPQTPMQQQFVPGSYMMSSSQELNNTIDQETPNNSVSNGGSVSSLFNRSNSISNNTLTINGSQQQQLSTSIGRSNHIFSSSISNNNNHSSSMTSKPKNYLSKTKSTFVLRFLIHENLQKILSAKTDEDYYLFYNIGSSFIWMDNKSKDPLSRIVFSKSYPLCHDVNESTRCDDHLDIIIGFSTGDIVWYDPISCKYVRLNKGGSMVSSAVSMIKWIPGSDELFIAAFKDGSVMIMGKERDDQAFVIPEPTSWTESQFYATRPHKSSKYNPISYWKVSKEGLTDFSFSPDGIHLALTGSDGQLRIVDYRNERLTDIFSSYYGKLVCVDWSPDGHYIVTGGQDDLVTIWSFIERKMVARCQGHKSWITGVAFDPWNCDEQTYRFASKPKHSRGISPICASSTKWPTPPPLPLQAPPNLPSFSASTEPVERKRSLKSHKLFRGFSSSTDTLNSTSSSNGGFSKNFRKKKATKNEDDGAVLLMDEQRLPVLHPPVKKNYAALLQPTTMITIHADPCVSVQFTEDYMMTTDRRGRTRIWGRP
ncbi:hypothetical protein G6F37_000312 [Rhizopus arrhizus]|nr:hypothetical protein G6F38_001437 [Rhizopus arrhizus]KAG1164401.1 hypothetical protein G6F37_000312 [Rhizopus arrhizus]